MHESNGTERIVVAKDQENLYGVRMKGKSKKEIKESFYPQEPPPRTLIRGGAGFPNGGTTMREFCGRGDRWKKGGIPTLDKQGKHGGITTTATLEDEKAIGAVAIQG
ncbi:hypothetical protein M5K25_013790 [Dendrobium thyrsiflorum]|uniref:Uncharacterized protein n=1 Tax=Dendrobium thyrsiflorum TaxID=117978 RepID=A0ABD0UTZ6_DENTH